MNKYNIPQHTAVEMVSSAKLGATAVLYGIGIGQAVLREKLGETKSSDFQNTDNLQFPYNPDAKPNKNGGFDKTEFWDGRMSSSLVGMPVMCYIRFNGRTYTELDGTEVTLEDVIFDTVVITATMNPDIVSTKVSGRKTGSVKEYIGQDDWNVEIRAIITSDSPVNDAIQKVDPNGHYPRDNMYAISNMLQAGISFEIDCWYLNNLGIYFLVIDRGITIEQIEGEYSMQRLIIPCLSDSPLKIPSIKK